MEPMMAQAEIITIEHYDFVSMTKIVTAEPDPLTGIVSVQMVPYQDTIHPYPLAFDPPLIEHANPEALGGFRHRWEKLNFAFALSDPGQFPSLPALSDDDRLLAQRFIKVCKRLAGYSAINADSRLRLATRDGKTDIELDYPSDESFAAAALAFRQLHSGQEAASFEKVQGRLFKAIAQLPMEARRAPKKILQQWISARGKLMNQLLETIVCRKAAPENGPTDFPYSYYNIKPESLIRTFQYGDTIHFSTERDNLAALTENATNDAYYKYAVLLAITGLSHIYFGFALLVETALKP
jgi:hypothetical protein